MADAYIGEIRMFGGNYAPEDWHFCDGSLLNIPGNEALFSLIGTTYGGDGRTTFGLPDLRGRLPIGQGQGSGLTNRVLGQKDGSEAVTLTASTMSSHSHAANATNSAGTLSNPQNGIWASPVNTQQPTTAVNQYIKVSEVVPPKKIGAMDPVAIGNAGGNRSGGTDAHDNMMPFLTINYIISLTGLYPDRPQ